MGCHPRALARLARNIREHPESVDYWLDQWWDMTQRATEWDADAWGFDPQWMAEERARMAAGPTPPRRARMSSWRHE